MTREMVQSQNSSLSKSSVAPCPPNSPLAGEETREQGREVPWQLLSWDGPELKLLTWRPSKSVTWEHHRPVASLFALFLVGQGTIGFSCSSMIIMYSMTTVFIYDELLEPKACQKELEFWGQKVYSFARLLSENEEREENSSITQKDSSEGKIKSFFPPPLYMCYGSNCISSHKNINVYVEVLTPGALERDLMGKQNPCRYRYLRWSH